MKIYKKILNAFQNRFFLKNYILILMPSLVFILFMIISIISFTKTYKEVLEESYTTNLISICSQTENSINNLINTVDMLYLDDQFIDIVCKNENHINQEDIYNAATVLDYLKNTNHIIDSAFILNRSQELVYGTIGKYSTKNFFENVYSYKDYSYEYWQKYQSPITDHQILPPSTVKKYAGDENVIPLVFTKIGDFSLNSIIVINIKISRFFDILEKNKLTSNSFFNIINKHQLKIYDKTSVVDYGLDKDFYNKCINNVKSNFNYNIKGSTHMVISYSPYDSVLGYSYVVFVPNKDIHTKVAGFLFVILCLGIVVVLIVLYTAKFSLKELYKPINKLVNKISSSDNAKIPTVSNHTENDPIIILDGLFDEIKYQNTELQSKLQSSLTLVQERNLITLLNQNEHYIENAENYLLKDDLVDFEYDFFCSIIIKINLTDKFYTEYNTVEYNRIFIGLKSIVKSIFAELYNTYIIPCETADTFYILLNMEDKNQEENINNALLKIKNLLKEDAFYITAYIANGGIYEGIKGMRQSHHNATKEISNKTNLERNSLNLSVNDNNTNNTVLFSKEDEGRLTDYCLVGQTEQAFRLIKKIVITNIKRHISVQDLENLYSRLISIVLNVIRNKEIDYQIDYDSDSELITTIVKKETQEIFTFIESLMDLISKNAKTESKVDIASIKKYIDTHYQENSCGIDHVADIFGASSKYLSRKFKEETGITFTNYLTECRVNQAKSMLVQTNSSVSDIGQQVGYPIVSTFIRAFKKQENISPSEYRKQFKK